MDKNHYRTTISIPLDLKRRMDEVDGQVNWSAVAAKAFEAHIAYLETDGKKINELRSELKQLQAKLDKLAGA
jgi:hypothetical protein